MSGSPILVGPMCERSLLGLSKPGRVPVLEGSPQPAPTPHLCTLLDISMGRPMFRDSRLKLGSKYSSGEMAVGLVGLAACCTGAWVGPRTRLELRAAPAWPCPVVPSPCPPALAHPIVGGVLLGHPEEGLERSLPPYGEGWEPMRGLWATAPRLHPLHPGSLLSVGRQSR